MDLTFTDKMTQTRRSPQMRARRTLYRKRIQRTAATASVIGDIQRYAVAQTSLFGSVRMAECGRLPKNAFKL
jgi:hypothetical protein